MTSDAFDFLSRARQRVLVDGHDLFLPEGTGIATYAASLLRCITAMGLRPEVVFGPTAPRGDAADLDRGLFDRPRPPPPPGAFERLRWILGPASLDLSPIAAQPERLAGDPGFSRLPREVGLLAADRLFLRARAIFAAGRRVTALRLADPPAILHLTRPTPVRIPGVATVTSVHDLVPLLLPGAIGSGRRLNAAIFAAAVRHSDHLVTVSDHVRHDVITHLGVDPARVTTVPPAVTVPDPGPDTAERAARLAARFGLTPGGYHLFYGSIEPKKNVARLIRAHAAAGVRRPLVIVSGRSWGSPEAEALLRGARVGGDGPGLLRLPHLPPSDLHMLVASARSVLLPSLMEGFGLPVVEGFLHGVPVVTSRGGATEEVAGDAALLVDPTDIASIAAGISRMDADDAIAADLIDRGRRRAAFFSEERMAASLAPIYERLIVVRDGSPRAAEFAERPPPVIAGGRSFFPANVFPDSAQ